MSSVNGSQLRRMIRKARAAEETVRSLQSEEIGNVPYTVNALLSVLNLVRNPVKLESAIVVLANVITVLGMPREKILTVLNDELDARAKEAEDNKPRIVTQ